MELFRHPGASAVVPFLSDPAGADPQVLLIKQYRYASGGYLYEIPAGRLDPGEDPADCARRELQEETGCTAERVERLTTIFTTPGFCDEQIHLFMAVGIARGEHAREKDEFLEVETLPLSRALAMIERGEIRDSKSVVALLFASGFRLGR
jgi:ADP-ribose pyrophosphatase